MKKALLVSILAVFLQFFVAFLVSPAHAIDIGGDCGFDQINLSDEVGQVFNERIEAVLRAVTSGKSLFGGLIFLAVISLYLDYLRGQLDWKGFMVRVAITIFLLKSYTGEGNFRDTISNAADKAANSIQFGYPGGNALEAMFETLYQMFKNLQGGSGTPGSVRVINWLGNLFGIGEIGDAAHVVALFFSPAGITTILFILTTLIVAILSYVLDVGATLLLLVLSLLGPIAICFCSIRSTMSIATGWFQRFVEINLWKIIYACFMVGIATVYEKLGAIAFNPEQYANATDPLTQMTCAFSAMLLSIVVAVVSIFMLTSIPSIASAIVEGRGSGMGMTASFLVGAGAASVMNGIRSGVGALRQKTTVGNSSSSSTPGGTTPTSEPNRRTMSNDASDINTRMSAYSYFRRHDTDHSGKRTEEGIEDSKSETVTQAGAIENKSMTTNKDLRTSDAKRITNNVQNFPEKTSKQTHVQRFHQGNHGTQVITISKYGFLGRTHYRTTTTDASGSITEQQSATDPVEAAKNHRDQLRKGRSSDQKFSERWNAIRTQDAKASVASKYIASSDDGKISISDFRDRSGKRYMQTVHNRSGNILMRTPIHRESETKEAFNKHLISASATGQTFNTAQGSRAMALSKRFCSDQSDITVFRTSEGKFAVQERSGNGEVKRSHVAASTRDALNIRDDWKTEGVGRNVSYSNDDLHSPGSHQIPSRTHQSEDGDVQITTTKGRDHHGKESYLIEKTNTKTRKTERTTASSSTDAKQKHNRFLQDEDQAGRKFREIKI
jgi:hypothetical protein